MVRKVNAERAGTDELREQREFLSDEYRKLRDADQLAKTVAEIADENDGIRRCVLLEGEASFYKWWDDDVAVPPMGSRRVRIRMLEERIASLDPPADEYIGIPPNGKAPFRGSEVEEAESNHIQSVTDEKTDGEKSREEAQDWPEKSPAYSPSIAARGSGSTQEEGDEAGEEGSDEQQT